MTAAGERRIRRGVARAMPPVKVRPHELPSYKIAAMSWNAEKVETINARL